MLVYLTQYELQEKQSLHNGIRKASAEYFMAYCNNNSTPIPIPSSYLSSIRITHNIPCPKNYYERNLRKPNSCVDLFRPCLECRIFIGKAYIGNKSRRKFLRKGVWIKGFINSFMEYCCRLVIPKENKRI